MLARIDEEELREQSPYTEGLFQTNVGRKRETEGVFLRMKVKSRPARLD